VIRDPAQSGDISAVSANPHVLSLEAASISEVSKLLQDTRADLVYFSAGAGGKGPPERTKAVDYDGAVKVFDAIEAVPGNEKPRLILVSAIDCRNPDKLDQYPAHYNEEDKERSKKAHEAIGRYYKWKFEADKNLVGRKTFKWTILRPSGLTDEPGTGLVEIGRTHISPTVSVSEYAVYFILLISVNRGMMSPKRYSSSHIVQMPKV